MKRFVIAVCLIFNICFADSYKDELNDNIEIVITHLSEKKIFFEFKQDNKILFSGNAVDKYSHLGLESNNNEYGRIYEAIEYWNTANECLLSFRIQCEPADENDTKTRLRVVANKNPKCKKCNALENIIFFKQGL